MCFQSGRRFVTEAHLCPFSSQQLYTLTPLLIFDPLSKSSLTAIAQLHAADLHFLLKIWACSHLVSSLVKTVDPWTASKAECEAGAHDLHSISLIAGLVREDTLQGVNSSCSSSRLISKSLKRSCISEAGTKLFCPDE
ncbi:hypothetical protein AMECASPLE_017001 [Ameca splendens]|uniref:Uncharacterized protein n=1 Tax=Ameca splendens TaxID=208324 RepID=A0ABV0YDE7_9TELE